MVTHQLPLPFFFLWLSPVSCLEAGDHERKVMFLEKTSDSFPIFRENLHIVGIYEICNEKPGRCFPCFKSKIFPADISESLLYSL